MSECPSHFALERAVLENDVLIEPHLSSCTRCGTLAEEIRNDQKAFRVSHPFEPFYEKLKKRRWIPSYAGMTKSWFSWKTLVPLGSMALLLLMIRWNDPGIRYKGNPEIGFYILDNGESHKGKKQQVVHPGDQIRLYANSNQYSYVLIYGIEENGALNRYYPDRGEE